MVYKKRSYATAYNRENSILNDTTSTNER